MNITDSISGSACNDLAEDREDDDEEEHDRCLGAAGGKVPPTSPCWAIGDAGDNVS